MSFLVRKHYSCFVLFFFNLGKHWTRLSPGLRTVPGCQFLPSQGLVAPTGDKSIWKCSQCVVTCTFSLTCIICLISQPLRSKSPYVRISPSQSSQNSSVTGAGVSRLPDECWFVQQMVTFPNLSTDLHFPCISPGCAESHFGLIVRFLMEIAQVSQNKHGHCTILHTWDACLVDFKVVVWIMSP